MSAEELVWGWKNPEYREGGSPAGEITLDPWTLDGMIVTIVITTGNEVSRFSTEQA